MLMIDRPAAGFVAVALSSPKASGPSVDDEVIEAVKITMRESGGKMPYRDALRLALSTNTDLAARYRAAHQRPVLS